MKRIGLFIFFIFCYFLSNAQNLFLEKTFVGGVTVAGRTSLSFIDGYFKIKWESDYELVAAYALTYRYGRPTGKSFTINGAEFLWDSSSQVGEEQLDNDNVQYFATNVMEISDRVVIANDSIYVTMNGADFIQQHPNQGWWSLDFVFLYSSPSINDTTNIRIYTASKPQTEPQSYTFDSPIYKSGTDVGFSIYSDRVGGPFGPAYEDRTCIAINGQSLGCIWSADETNIGASGVRGHFYYEHGTLTGLDDDSANTVVYKSDGIAVINEYLNDQANQSLYLNPVNYQNPIYGFNPHPAFFIVYTPDGCGLATEEMPREYTTCYQQSTPRGQPDKTDSLTLQALPGYDHYDWTPGINFNDSTLANPTLKPDSSGWYRVRMWSDDPAGLCAQTIPVFVTVGEVPRPGNLKVSATSCPAITGRIEFKDMAGQPPFQYTVNGHTQSSAVFSQLESGSYALSVVDHLGCTWDTTVVVPLSPLQQAAFTANPEAGYSPLSVSFYNESTNANSYQWLIDGEAFSTTKNTFYTFPDSGTYSIALVAYGSNTMCSDTAYITITVDQGLELIVPNIITPNGDGMNDALVAKIAGVRSMHWEVLNRWGNTLFSGDALKPVESYTLWSPAKGEYPAGVYAVVLTLEGNSGEVRKMAVQVMVK